MTEKNTTPDVVKLWYALKEEATTNDLTTTPDEYAANAPKFAAPIADLWNWSHNFDGFAPFCMLLDLVGFSEDEYGRNIHNWTDAPPLGWYDLDMLATAVAAWADRPTDCADWVRGLLFCEQTDAE